MQSLFPEILNSIKNFHTPCNSINRVHIYLENGKSTQHFVCELKNIQYKNEHLYTWDFGIIEKVYYSKGKPCKRKEVDYYSLSERLQKELVTEIFQSFYDRKPRRLL